MLEIEAFGRRKGCKLGLVDPNLPLMASLPADSLEEDALLGVSRLKQPVDICMAIATALSGSCRPLFLSENTSKLLRLSCLKLSGLLHHAFLGYECSI